MRIAVKSLLVLASVLLVYMCYRSIMNPMEFDKEKDIRDKAVIARLVDIRKAQIAYKETKSGPTNAHMSQFMVSRDLDYLALQVGYTHYVTSKKR